MSKSIPVSLRDVAEQNSVRIGFFSDNKELIKAAHLEGFLKYDGIAVRMSTHALILCKDDILCNQRDVIARGLGHIFLGHLDPPEKGQCNVMCIIAWPKSCSKTVKEARTFAYRLLQKIGKSKYPELEVLYEMKEAR